MPNTYAGFPYASEEYAGPPVSNSPYVEINGGAFPYRYVEVAFGNGPNDANPTWTNIASDVTQISTRRGRQRTLGRFEAGTATVTLDNKSGKYSPFNSSSPYYNQIRPGMPLRFRAGWGPLTYTEFTGFVESWPLTWPAANDSVLSVTAVDAMKFLNLKKATSINTYSPTVLADGPIAYYKFTEAVGATTVTDSSGNGYTLSKRDFIDEGLSAQYPQGQAYTFQQPGPFVADPTPSLFAGHREVVWKNTAAAALHVGFPVNLTIEAWVKLSGWKDQLIASLFDPFHGGLRLGTDLNGNADFDAPTYGTITTEFNLVDDHWHHVVVTLTTGFVATIYIDGVQYGQVTGSGTFAWTALGFYVGGQPTTGDDQFALEGSVSQVAIYNTTLTGARVLAHYNAGLFPRQLEATGQRVAYLAGYTGIPAANQRIDAGLIAVQGATDTWLTGTILRNMQDQADTENGDLFIDASGNLTFFDRNHTSRSPYSSVALILGDSGAAPEEPYRLDGLTVSYDDQDVVNEVVVTPDGLAPQTASDATSQAAYGTRTQSIATLAASTADAATRAASVIALYKTPVPRVDSVTVNPADDPTMLFGPVLGFDLLTRVQLRRRPKDGAGSTFDQVALIEGIEHKVTKGTWETTWRLSTLDAM